MLDKQAATQERNELTEVDPWIVAVERSKTRMTTEEWSKEGWTTAMTASARRKTKLQEAMEIFRAMNASIDIICLTTWEALGRQVAAERANATAAVKEEDQVGRLHRELEAARAGASEADARRHVADQKMEAERAAELMCPAFNRARDSLEEYGLRPMDPPDRSVAGYAVGFGRVADCLDRLRDAIDDRYAEDARVRAGLLPEPRPFLPHGDGAGGRRGGRRGGGTRAAGSRAGDGVEVCPGDGPSRRSATSWRRRRGRQRRECMMDDGQAVGWPRDAYVA
ncbi:uncharacterized protein LOC101781963 [Setaria italica]|uniref:uncharacterized protein LOC101781963 n=1 Tax=Setaria italica TaxID=4555 RepID=UPI000BE57B94|nr:uncharacterized protein LOC101781963 [Setaria italica]